MKAQVGIHELDLDVMHEFGVNKITPPKEYSGMPIIMVEIDDLVYEATLDEEDEECV